jgi:hypothetical protein
MSEQLSSRGRAGAEEVTDVMNSTFSALLEKAYALGGGLLKFGGDALLLLYEGDRHAERAARAAFEMRRTLRSIGRPRTSAGTVQLRMHAGLHTGRFQFFLVGDSHRELLVTGPAASRTVEMEAASEAGEILVSRETAAGSAVTLETRGPGDFCRQRRCPVRSNCYRISMGCRRDRSACASARTAARVGPFGEAPPRRNRIRPLLGYSEIIDRGPGRRREAVRCSCGRLSKRRRPTSRFSKATSTVTAVGSSSSRRAADVRR